MRKIINLLALIALLPLLAFTSNVEFTASAPQEVAVGERFRVTFQVNARPSSFNGPAFQGFRALSGPNQSSSTSMQIINNQTTVTETFTYTYLLEASQEGSFTIPAASVVIDGTTHQSNQVTVRVRAGAPGAQPSPAPRTQPSPDQPARATDEELFVRATASTTNPFQGQQVIVTYNLYTRITVHQYSIDGLPSYRGFWSENLTQQGQPQARTQIIDGHTYRVAEIYRVAVFPQRSGELTIDPLEAELVISLPGQRRQSLFDEFFGGSPFDQRRNIRQKVQSNSLRFNVKPLPTQNRPAAFTGMVGTEFDVNATLNMEEMGINDAANLRIAISGKGNMRMLEQPSINFPANLEVFDPNISDNIRNTTSGVSGSRTFDYVMIPRTGGEFVIPAWDFVYFDPVAERYVTRQTPEFTIQVSGDPGIAGTAAGVSAQEAIRLLGTDIRFIRTGAVTFVPRGEVFFGSSLFWLLLIIPFVLFAFFVIYWRNQIRLHSNQDLLRNKKAQKLARKRLKVAKAFMDKKSENEFYDEIFRALWGYLSDKLSIPVSILNKENVEGAFRAQKVPEELSENFLSTLNDTEFARFAPGEKEDRMTEIYDKALRTIVKLEKELRNKKS